MAQGVQASPAQPNGIRAFGWLRYVAALLAFGVITYIGVAYVWHFSAEEATRSWAILTAVALGIGAFGVYCFVRARYLRV